ncbi:Rpn family recombination-promoting nuclease/putative transposase [Bernardetia sp.]|uniref:Rpn family recombination-promoting nuclease/putative transposase n=1 Tax=Bernardetia sp. TaxID=1937974 RepID=UPI0025C43049|nr:Rpn family recombination-promoting nuclease/putative transposase [Bernardetia sp.]
MKLIHFDWAIKKMLRHKANFGILEGFLTELLKFDLKIEQILESEGNQETDRDKFNRVDILIRTTKGELMLVEIQNSPETDYFHRMIYGVSKLITEYVKLGDAYSEVKKVYSINIVYFSLGQGEDYIYEYDGKFVGRRLKDVLLPTSHQKTKFDITKVADIFPKYYILKVNNFDDVAKDTLDEWIYFLKNSEIKDNFKAKGIDEAREKMRYEKLDEQGKKVYDRFQESIRIEKSVLETAEETGEQRGKKEKALEIARNLKNAGVSSKTISQTTGLSEKEIENL